MTILNNYEIIYPNTKFFPLRLKKKQIQVQLTTRASSTSLRKVS